MHDYSEIHMHACGHHVFSLLYIVDATYESSGKHTYLPMTINGGTLILVLLMFVVLYKQLAPRTHSASVKELNTTTEKSTVIKSSGKAVQHIN